MRTVAKALAILDLFAEETPSLRLAEIAERTGLDRATAYRMLQTLCEFGYLIQSAETKKYQLGATVNRHATLTPYQRPKLTPPMRRRDQGLSRRN